MISAFVSLGIVGAVACQTLYVVVGVEVWRCRLSKRPCIGVGVGQSECRDQFDLEVVMRRRRPRTKGERKAQCVINVSRSERQSITEHHGREICPYNDNDYCNSAP